MSQTLLYDESKFDGCVQLEYLLNRDIGCFLEFDLNNPDDIKEKTKIFKLCPENGKVKPDIFTPYMSENESNTYTEIEKLICDWTDKKNFLVRSGMLNFYVRHGMEVYKVHEIVSITQFKWLENYINFYNQKRNQAVIDFENDF